MSVRTSRGMPPITSVLSKPFAFPNGRTVLNRIVKAAMTERLAGPDGLPNDKIIRLYGRFADGGAGMLITGNVVIDHIHLEAPGNMILTKDSDLRPFRELAKTMKRAGGLAIMQVNHAGRQTPRVVASTADAPSAVTLPLKKFFSEAVEMSVPMISRTLDAFVETSQLAEKAGFDGVEIHAAHGYLLGQFLSPRSNLRDDQWGGNIAGRSRALLEICRRVRECTRPDFILGVKLNAGDFIDGGLSPDDALGVAEMLGTVPVDFVEVSGGTHEFPVAFHGDDQDGEAIFQSFAKRLKSRTSAAIILTGRLRTKSAMERVITDGDTDLVGMARPLAMDPELPTKLLSGAVDRAKVVNLRLPKGPRKALAELSWAGLQLDRLSKGKAPNLGMSPRIAMYRMLLRSARAASKAKRYWRRKAERLTGHGLLGRN